MSKQDNLTTQRSQHRGVKLGWVGGEGMGVTWSYSIVPLRKQMKLKLTWDPSTCCLLDFTSVNVMKPWNHYHKGYHNWYKIYKKNTPKGGVSIRGFSWYLNMSIIFWEQIATYRGHASPKTLNQLELWCCVYYVLKVGGVFIHQSYWR